MKSVNGIFLIVIGVFFLWLGATGRFPKLIEALGIIRGSNPTSTKEVNPTQKSGSTPSFPAQGQNALGFDRSLVPDSPFSIGNLWKAATTNEPMQAKGASVSW
jgi:hypothetical protein